jgi:TPP-dependent pyruvate/acetoin dehydrogenase alpha subunit
MSPEKKTRLWMYATMVKSRHFEALIKQAYLEGKRPQFNMAKGPIPGEMHLSDGQEPCAVGVCAHLQAQDTVTATHRPHHVAIAKGVDLPRMAAEIFGKQSGLSGGRGGHMHLFDASVHFCCSGIIAQGMGPAVGAAMAGRMRGSSAIAVSFIGEGAANQGAFHESLNLAAIWKAPVVFVIEDNAWGISVPKTAVTAIKRNSDRAAAYGIPGVFVPGPDPDLIYAAAGEAVARARGGAGPTLIEIETYRLEGHFMGDAEGYRPAGEVASLKAKDPIPLYRQRLLDAGVTPGEVEAAEKDAKSQVEAALSFARSAAYPPVTDAFTEVFA